MALLAALAIAPVLVVAGPLGPLPGGVLGGTPAEAPESWGDTSDLEEIELEVPGVMPRVVIVWFVEHEGALHGVGGRSSGWVEGVGTGSPLEMRLEDRTYALTASPVTEGWESILEAYSAKYRAEHPDTVAGFPPLDEAAGSVAVFRLER